MAAEAEQQHCRIGKVRFRSGGEMTVLRQPQISEEKAELIEALREIIADDRPVGGYVVTVIRGADSATTYARACDNVPLRCLPEYVAESLRRVMWSD